MDTAGGTDNDLGAGAESVHILTDVGTTDTGVAVEGHEVTNGDNDLLDLLSQLTGGSDDQGLAGLEVVVDLLESGDGESSSLSGTRLGLGNDIVACGALVSIMNCADHGEKHTLDDGHDSTLLDSGGTLETVSVDTYDSMLNVPLHICLFLGFY